MGNCFDYQVNCTTNIPLLPSLPSCPPGARNFNFFVIHFSIVWAFHSTICFCNQKKKNTIK
jgi:hypothetical protein